MIVLRRTKKILVLTLLSVFLLTTFSLSVKASSYKLDPAHSNVLFKAKHADIGYVYGMFLEYSGDFQYDPENPGTTNASLTVRTGSIFTNVKRRDNHLKGPDFFNAKQYPTMTFESTSAEVLDDERIELTGKLTIKGVTKTISPVVDLTGAGKGPQGDYRRGFSTSFTVNRMDYNVDYMPGGISKEITVIVTGEGIRQ